MLCAISLIFIFTVVGAYEVNTITTAQAIWFFMYGLIMFYHTSKPYWSQNNQGGKK